jgi:hypothetical protein
MESGIYILTGSSAGDCGLPVAGGFHVGGAGPLFSRATDGSVELLFEGILTAGRTEDLSDAQSALEAYRQDGLAGLKELDGFFRLALVLGEEKRVLVVSDPLATRPLYIYRSSGSAGVAPTPGFFTECGLPMHLDRQGLYQTFRFYHPIGRRTLIEEVMRSRPLTVYEIHLDGRVDEHVPGRVAKEPDPGIDLDRAALLIKECMQTILSGILGHPLLRGRPVHLPLTAGMDSRHILGELMEQGRTPEMLHHIRIKPSEYGPVGSMARGLSIPLNEKPVGSLDLAGLTRKWVRSTAGMLHYNQLYLMGVAEELPPNGVVGFDGYLCDHFLGLNRRPGMPPDRHFSPVASRLLLADHRGLARQCRSEIDSEFGRFEGPEDFRVRMFDAFNRGVFYTGAVYPLLGERALYFGPGAHRLAFEFCRRVPEEVAAWKRARLRMFHRYFPRLASFPSEYGPPLADSDVQPYVKSSKLPQAVQYLKGLLPFNGRDPMPGTNHEWLRRVPYLRSLHRLVTGDCSLARDGHLRAGVPARIFQFHQAGGMLAYTLMSLTSAEVAYRLLVKGQSESLVADWLDGR